MNTPGWGVAGPGRIAGRFAEAMTMVPGGRIVAVASRSIERADAYADRFGVARRYDDFGHLAADADVDIVYVATPHNRHESDTLRFLAAGKHVLVEKPIALNAAQARRMVDAARANGVFLMEAVWSRFLPAYSLLYELLGQDRIGEVRMVEADFGFRRPVEPSNRLFNAELGGGALLDLGIYPVQLCTSVLGVPERSSGFGSIGETGVDELVVGVLDHGAGRMGLIKAALRLPMPCTARISGTEGSIELPARMHCPEALTLNTPEGSETLDGRWNGDGLRFEIEHVQDCLAEGRTESAVMPLAESVDIAATLDAIRSDLGVVYPGE